MKPKLKIIVKCPECEAIYNKFVNSGFVECGCGEWVSDEHEIKKRGVRGMKDIDANIVDDFMYTRCGNSREEGEAYTAWKNIYKKLMTEAPMTGTNSDGSAKTIPLGTDTQRYDLEVRDNCIEQLQKELQEAKEEIAEYQKNACDRDLEIEQAKEERDNITKDFDEQSKRMLEMKAEIEQAMGEADRVYNILRNGCKHYYQEFCSYRNDSLTWKCATNRQDCPLFAAKKEWPGRIKTETFVNSIEKVEGSTRFYKYIDKDNPHKYRVVLEKIPEREYKGADGGTLTEED